MTRALIAEDEPLLADALRLELAQAWPELTVVAQVGDGAAAVEAARTLRPEVAFLDIRMPGMSGLDAARVLAEDWDAPEPPPLLVFVTAYDAHAVQAFELAAVDYLLKPVAPTRLAETVARVQRALSRRGPDSLAALAAQLGPLLDRLEAPAPRAPAPLRHLQASVGQQVRLIPLDTVCYLQATDKYVTVVTAEGEALLRTSLASLAPRLDAARFVRVHRGTLVNLDHVHAATRDEAGRTWLALRGRPERVAVSRVYAEHFRPM